MIYIASKTVHAPKWRALKDSGCPIISTWIYEAGQGESKSLEDLWLRCVLEATRADVLIAYREAGEILKGGLVEIGVALGRNRRVFLVGFDGSNLLDGNFSFKNHPLVTSCKDMEQAFTLAGKHSHSCKWKTYR